MSTRGLLTLVERKTKLTKIAKLPRATARATQKAAVRRLKPIADFVHTITFDNGKEFATHQDITHALKATIFFATVSRSSDRSDLDQAFADGRELGTGRREQTDAWVLVEKILSDGLKIS